MGSTSGEEKGKEGKTEHRKKLSCDSVSLEALANPKRSSEARTPFICPRLVQETQPLYSHWDLSLAVICSGRGRAFSQAALLNRGDPTKGMKDAGL